MSDKENEKAPATGQVVEFPGNPNAPAAEQPIPDQDEGRAEGEEMSPEDQRKAALETLDRLTDEEDRKLLSAMKAGERKLLKQEGPARHMARKVLDPVTGEASIDRYVEYGNNPFVVVYMLPGQVVVEAAQTAGGVLVKYDGSMAFIPGAQLAQDKFGFGRIA